VSEGLPGKRVLVTRAKGQNQKLSRQLETVGAVPVEFPTIQIISPDNPTPLDTAIANLDTYQWLIFTSANGVEYFWQRLITAEKGPADVQNIQLAAIGPATAAAMSERGLRIDLIPTEHVAEILVDAMDNVAGQRILLPTADIARDTLAKGLQAKGAVVDRVTAYQNKPVTDPGNLATLLPTIDILTFTSASTVRNFVSLLEIKNLTNAIEAATVACIGPITAQTAEELALPVHIIAETYTIPGLVEALVKYFRRNLA
jgi:uroporphyrinogen III methyltransferase/synthase